MPTDFLQAAAALFEKREDLRPTIRFDPWPDEEWTLDLTRERPHWCRVDEKHGPICTHHLHDSEATAHIIASLARRVAEDDNSPFPIGENEWTHPSDRTDGFPTYELALLAAAGETKAK